jgi:hypothetical protein
MNVEREINRQLGGRLVFARVLWFGLVALTLALFLLAIPARFNQLVTITPLGDNALVLLSMQEADLLQAHGVSIELYALYFIALETGFAAIFVVIGLIIFWRKTNGWLAMLASLTLITVGVLMPGTVRVLDTPQSVWALPVHLVQVLGWSSFFTCLYIFPDGRFVPDWTRFFPLLSAIWAAAWILTPAANVFNWHLPFALLVFSIAFGGGLLAQLYRYHRVSTPTEQQQTKWVIFGFAIAISSTLIFLTPGLVFPSLNEPGLPRIAYHLAGITIFAFGFLSIPITLDIAIRRYRLWAIDPIVNRALVYGILTVGLALVYGVCVVLLQQLFYTITGKQESELITVLATLAIAALFNPLRRRVQEVIDRRFYRRKYDAERVLAAFSATVREQVELEKLTARLIEVARETMEPTSVSVWLKK